MHISLLHGYTLQKHGSKKSVTAQVSLLHGCTLQQHGSKKSVTTHVSLLQGPHVLVHGHTFALVEVGLHALLVESHNLLFFCDVLLLIGVVQALESLQHANYSQSANEF